MKIERHPVIHFLKANSILVAVRSEGADELRILVKPEHAARHTSSKLNTECKLPDARIVPPNAVVQGRAETALAKR